MALSVIGSAGTRGGHGLDNHGLSPVGHVYWNLEWQALYDAALRRGEGGSLHMVCLWPKHEIVLVVHPMINL